MNSNLISYYKDRAKEYEKIYARPERQGDLLKATQLLQPSFAGRQVLEIACGTGYWTERIARTAKAILATDINNTVLDVAKSKVYSPAEVTFLTADLFNLPIGIRYESLFGGFIWSHIPLQELNDFLKVIQSYVVANGTIVLMDNNYVEGSSLPISDRDEQGNSYQIRQLENGSTHKVLKNFPTEHFIKNLLKDKASNLDFISLEYYWILRYKNV